MRRPLDALDAVAAELVDLDDWLALCLAEAEPADEVLDSVAGDLDGVEAKLSALEFRRMFSGALDANNAFLEIQAGAGGTEAQDWVDMLHRMYLRWGERRGFETAVQDDTPGEVTGYISVSMRFSGEHAFGWLRTEGGVHRLVRRSPFDAGNRRHTSFAGVRVMPEIGDEIDVAVEPSELRVDTYRASGAGGQHVNKTDSAVRVTHFPSGIVVQCQSERSQHQNRDNAMRRLKAQLYDLKQRRQHDAIERLGGEKVDISFGSQIRSYVLDSGRIKDLRTKVETGNCTAVLDGDIDLFLQESLKQGV